MLAGWTRWTKRARVTDSTSDGATPASVNGPETSVSADVQSAEAPALEVVGHIEVTHRIAAAVTPGPPTEEALRALAFSRVTRLATWFVVALGLLTVSLVSLPRLFAPADLAEGKHWRASSTLESCHPDRIECGGVRTSIFFHTREEEQPWVEFDLGAPITFRSVSVRNRTDGFQDRAVPLVLEVSDDRQTWRQLGQRDDPFITWTSSFDAVSARYVRLRAARRTFLHLESIKVHP